VEKTITQVTQVSKEIEGFRIPLSITFDLLDEKRAERSLISHVEESCPDDDITPLLDPAFSVAEWRQVSYTTLFTLSTLCLARYLPARTYPLPTLS